MAGGGHRLVIRGLSGLTGLHPILGLMTMAAPTAGFLSLGQPHARAAALRAAQAGRMQHTLLVHGPAGAGKGAFTDDLLALLFCQAADFSTRPCNACRGCRDARVRAHPDLVMGGPERWREERATGESIVAAARRWLLASAGAPIAADQRVVLIEGADRANEQTQNALLKALEEPSPRQMFVLVADEPGRLLPTIRSRAQPLRIGPVPKAQLGSWLVEHERQSPAEAALVARLAGGLTGRAIGYARANDLLTWRERTQRELLGVMHAGRAERFDSVRHLLDEAAKLGAPPADEAEPVADEEAPRVAGAAQRAAALVVLGAWRDLARDLLMASVGRPELMAAAVPSDELRQAAQGIERQALTAFLSLAGRIADGLRENAAPRLALEVAMLAWPASPSSRPIAA
jgi:DNA polymerase III delta prime subunit